MFSLYLQSISAQFSHRLNKRSLVTVLQSSKIWSHKIKDLRSYSKLKSQSRILCIQNYAYGYFYCKHGTNWVLVWMVQFSGFRVKIRSPWAKWGRWVRFWAQFKANSLRLASRIWHLLVTLCALKWCLCRVFLLELIFSRILRMIFKKTVMSWLILRNLLLSCDVYSCLLLATYLSV